MLEGRAKLIFFIFNFYPTRPREKSSSAHFLGLERKVLLERNRQDLALGILDLLEADEPVLETLFERQSAVEIDSGKSWDFLV